MGVYIYSEIGREFSIYIPGVGKTPVKNIVYRCKPYGFCQEDKYTNRIVGQCERLKPHRHVVGEFGNLWQWKDEVSPRACFYDDPVFGVDLKKIGYVVDRKPGGVLLFEKGCKIEYDTFSKRITMLSPKTGKHTLAADSSPERIKEHWQGFLANQEGEQ